MNLISYDLNTGKGEKQTLLMWTPVILLGLGFKK